MDYIVWLLLEEFTMKRKTFYLLLILAFASTLNASSLLYEQELTTEPLEILSETPLLRVHNVGRQPVYIPEYNAFLEDGESLDLANDDLRTLIVQPVGVEAKIVYSREYTAPTAHSLLHLEARSPRAKPAPFTKPAGVTDEIWAEIQPYLMPVDHPARKTLDDIFSQFRVVANSETIAQAGFNLTPQQGVHVHATKHPRLSGYVVKIYPDLHPEREWFKWIKRCQGAELVRDAIARFNYGKTFKVPHKWVYVLPDQFAVAPQQGIYPKHFILVVEDMKILDPKENRSRYHSKHMHRATLQALVNIMEDLGLSDAVRCANVPFCKDGKLAFVDTESWHRWPVWYHPTKEWLAIPMRKYWNEITACPRQGP